MASAATSAPSRAVSANQLTEGSTAKTSPEASPAQEDTSRLPSAVTKAAATARATADGSRSANSPEPPTRATSQISA